ncbi:MAG: hypothetical protein Q8P59_13105 [Dehalococcoidia bacterium]|nr:hypothetical protein [Dehalococcoidia bacterium]
MIKTSYSVVRPGKSSRMKPHRLSVVLRESLGDGCFQDNRLTADNPRECLELAYKVWDFYRRQVK